MSEELRHFLQHLLEFAVLLPAGFFAFMPVEDKLRYSDRKTDLLTGTLLIVFDSGFRAEDVLLRKRGDD